MRFPTPKACLILASLALAASGLAASGPLAYVAALRTDRNSRLAHEILVGRARRGGIDLYSVGDSITRRWGATDHAPPRTGDPSAKPAGESRVAAAH